MNKTPRNLNNGIKTIAKREWEAKQAEAKAIQVAKVKSLNSAAMAAMVRGIK